jgi:hypothetical protein
MQQLMVQLVGCLVGLVLSFFMTHTHKNREEYVLHIVPGTVHKVYM